MKKIAVLVLVLAMALSLVACGGNGAADAENAASALPTQESTVSENTGSNNGGSSDNKGFEALNVDNANRVCTMEITGMKMGKEKYAAGEPITVTVTWTGEPAEDTWIGIIPAEVPHGSEEENDGYDVDYRYFIDMSSGGTFTFEEIVLEPGDYTMRINESDGGGAELAWCAFSVK